MKTPANVPQVMVQSADARFATPQELGYLLEPTGGLLTDPTTGKIEISEEYQKRTWETFNKNLDANGALAVKDPATKLMATITYANGIVKTFAWNGDKTLHSITLSGPLPAYIPVTTKTFTWTGTGFSWVYS
jgi:hypothetical protein